MAVPIVGVLWYLLLNIATYFHSKLQDNPETDILNSNTMAEETAKQDETKIPDTKEDLKKTAVTTTNGDSGKKEESDTKNDTIQLTLDEGESLAENDVNII